jgi:hypothetical protein
VLPAAFSTKLWSAGARFNAAAGSSNGVFGPETAGLRGIRTARQHGRKGRFRCGKLLHCDEGLRRIGISADKFNEIKYVTGYDAILT